MQTGLRLQEACAAWLAGVLIAACSGRALPSHPTAGATDGDDGAGTPDFEQGSDAASGSLAISFSASTSATCPGHCVELTPQIQGGVAPYTVRWSDGTTPDGGPREVCPTATTTYTAAVTDSSGNGGEIARADQQAQASVTVTVTPACAPDGGPSSGPGQEACSQSWSVLADNWSGEDGAGVRTAVDGAGDIYLATTFTGTVNVGGQTFQSREFNLLVVKMDSACRVLWAKAFGGPQATVEVASVAADATGDVIVAANLRTDSGGLVDFGSGPIGNSFSSVQVGVVFKLGADGGGLWSHAYMASSGTLDVIMVDLAVDPRGNTAFLATTESGATPRSVDFGGGAVGFGSSLVELDDTGAFVFDTDASLLAGASVSFGPQSVTMDSAGRIRVAGCEGSDKCQPALIALDAGGHTQWVRDVSTAGYDLQYLSAVRVDANDDVFAATTGATQLANDGWLFGSVINQFSASGSPSWTPPATIPEPAAFDDSLVAGWLGRLAVDPAGRALFASAFSGSADLGSAGSLTSAGGADAAVLRFDAGGRLIGAGRWGGTGDEQVYDLAADVTGDAVVAGRTGLAPDSGTGGWQYAIFVAKLGW
jgi:hypothetical protein